MHEGMVRIVPVVMVLVHWFTADNTWCSACRVNTSQIQPENQTVSVDIHTVCPLLQYCSGYVC